MKGRSSSMKLAPTGDYHTLPVGEGLALRWVGYRGAEGEPWNRGLCFAESADKLWLDVGGGHVEVVDRDAVRPIADLGVAELAPGAAVAAHSWGHGYRPGVVEEVLEPGLRYAVKLENGDTEPVFFDRLTAEPL